jgi:hypothetical protein
LVEESLNLAWHGARAEKQGFDITLERSFDPSAGEADIFPQDITRALLNLISNGFYAAIQRKAETNGGDYAPTLAASTKSLGDRVDRVAPSLGVTLFVRDIRSGADLAPAFDAGVSEHVDGLMMTAESVLVVHSAQIIDFAARLRLPAVYQYPTQVKSGGLMAYDANISDLHKSAALYVDKILKGAKPSDLPIQQPTKLSLVINLKAAKARPRVASIPYHPS